MKGPLFYSKILLFGEYGIIEDSKGLSIPYNFFNGALKISDYSSEESKKSNSILRHFSDYLKTIDINLDLNSLDKHIEKGMYFDSSIPRGYGIGSSGALVAAVYDKYAINKITVLENLTREKLLILKEIFSKMESFFHGKSSGLDPLNSYLSIPILIESKNDINVTGIPSQKSFGSGAVFLIDSGKTGSTAPMINIFMEKMKKEGFRNMLNSQFIKYTNICVDSFLSGDLKNLFKSTKKLSQIVFENFKPMIPPEFHHLWKKGIDNGSYFLKLCGSGGGGYILGFAPNIEDAKKDLEGYDLEVVYHF
ncbi:MAG: mevalonate kinase [Flavobacteriaceae bacterium]|jgi:mevalonate kinase|nr:mevalonate kinase [Flavobacteriaceae bacterium]|tara:strand:- start:17082 stop:18002 length:921 start_codon:yes stop_codon:yes gene_type:complete